jgi:hypothetical protein
VPVGECLRGVVLRATGARARRAAEGTAKVGLAARLGIGAGVAGAETKAERQIRLQTDKIDATLQELEERRAATLAKADGLRRDAARANRARTPSSKADALMRLRQAKQLDARAEKLSAAQLALSAHREALANVSIDAEIMAAFKGSSEALKAHGKRIGSVAAVEKLADDVCDQMDFHSDVADAISNMSAHADQSGLDDDDLEAELEELASLVEPETSSTPDLGTASPKASSPREVVLDEARNGNGNGNGNGDGDRDAERRAREAAEEKERTAMLERALPIAPTGRIEANQVLALVHKQKQKKGSGRYGRLLDGDDSEGEGVLPAGGI